MLWFRKQAKLEGAASGDVIEPAELEISFDTRLFDGALNTLLANIDERQGKLVDFVEALGKKHELFARVLADDQLAAMDAAGFDTVVETVFTARRKLPNILRRMAHDDVMAAVHALLYGDDALGDRMKAFKGAFPVEGKKEPGAIWDLGAELLHFRDPERYPLMTRWVWDEATESGALRELIANNDTMRHVPLSMEPGSYEAARVWMAEQLTERGFYRDLHFIIDLLQAQAYGEYMLGIASGVGMFSGELGTKSDPVEFIAKLLGVDPSRPSGRSRLHTDNVH